MIFGCTHEQATIPTSTLTKRTDIKYIGLRLFGDSAYITKKIGLRVLKHEIYNDTSDLKGSWDGYKDSDTIGKYYKSSATGNYIACIADHTNSFTSYVMLEFKKSKEGITVISKNIYNHGNYECCWDNFIKDGFRRVGDFLCFKFCSTGSGYCASRLFLFKHVVPMNENVICTYIWEAFTGISLTSTMTIKDNVLNVNYKLIKNKIVTTADIIKYVPLTSENFKIDYIFNGSRWYAKDSTLVNKTMIL